MTYPAYWTCPKCMAVVSDSNYCTNCAYQPIAVQPTNTPEPVKVPSKNRKLLIVSVIVISIIDLLL